MRKLLFVLTAVLLSVIFTDKGFATGQNDSTNWETSVPSAASEVKKNKMNKLFGTMYTNNLPELPNKTSFNTKLLVKETANPSLNTSNNKLTVTATAYTANCTGCSGTTKTGIDLIKNPNKKVIAVDPDIIPLGTKVHVEGYGQAIAGDIGGGIDGHEIDVFISSEAKAKNWGRQEVQVTILE